MPVYDTIIVGMGAAGCAAASVLCKAGKRVLALEAQDRVGGRVNTVPFGDGVVELGAEWIHGEENSPVYDLAVQHKVPLLRQDISFLPFRSDGSTLDSALVNELVSIALASVDEPPEVPEPLGQFATKRLTEYIQKNYPHLLEEKDFLPQFLDFIDLVVDNYESSYSWNDVTTHTNYEDLGGHLHASWHKNGYKTLFDILLNRYKNGPGYTNLDLQLRKVVSRISYPQQPALPVTVSCEDGTVHTAKNVIVTVSLGVLKERYSTMFYPPLPDAKADMIEKVSIGVMDKIVLLFPHQWWPSEPTFFGFIWKASDRAAVSQEDEWTTKILGASTPLGSRKALTIWTSGRMGKVIECLPEDVVKRKVMVLLRQFMSKGINIPEPINMLRSTWHSNPYTRGSYTFDNLETPLHPNARAILAEPLTDDSGAPRVLFAGEATDRTHFSTVHGAVDTGYREAARLLPKGKL